MSMPSYVSNEYFMHIRRTALLFTSSRSRIRTSLMFSLPFVLLGMLMSGCQSQSADIAPPIQAQSATAQTAPSSGTGAPAPGQWEAFDEVLRSGGIYKNVSGKYLKITFAPLGDSMDAIFSDTPSGSVTITNSKGDRAEGKFSLERDRTLTIVSSGKKIVFEMSKDGRTLEQIGGGQTLKLQP